MRKNCSNVCKLCPCLVTESTNWARMRTIVTAALQRQYSRTELIFWITVVTLHNHYLRICVLVPGNSLVSLVISQVCFLLCKMSVKLVNVELAVYVHCGPVTGGVKVSRMLRCIVGPTVPEVWNAQRPHFPSKIRQALTL